jgi:hypothetical protein
VGGGGLENRQNSGTQVGAMDKHRLILHLNCTDWLAYGKNRTVQGGPARQSMDKGSNE